MTKMDIVDQECFQRSSLIQIILGIIVNFSSLAPSMSLGFSAIALPTLLDPNNPHKLTDDQASWVASVVSVATPLGCFLSGPISDKYGRRVILICNNVVCFLGWITIAGAYYFNEYQYIILIVGRMLTGLSTGLASMPAAVYMAEISSPNLRGMFTTWSAASFSLGILVVYALGWILKDNWGITAAIVAAFPIIGTIPIIFYVPESPSWLISKNLIDKARISLIKIFGAKDYNLVIHEEMETLMQSKQQSNLKLKKTTLVGNLKHLFKKTCIKPFVLILAYFFFQQFSGVHVIVFYAVDVVKEIKVTMDPYLAICVIAATRVVAAIVVGVLSKQYGRRPLSLVSGGGMTICMIMIAAYLVVIKDQDSNLNLQSINWLPMSLLVIYFFSSTLGFLTMPFAMAAEVFPSNIRGVATGLVTCFAYVFNFIIVKVYHAMINGLGNYQTFFFYGAMSLAGTIFIALLLPETKGKTLQEIEEYFGKSKNKKKIDENGEELITKKCCDVV